jgi:hypothetical protein
MAVVIDDVKGKFAAIVGEPIRDARSAEWDE